MKNARLSLHWNESFSNWPYIPKLVTTKQIGTAELMNLTKSSRLSLQRSRYLVGLISWFVPWIVVSNNCSVTEAIQEMMIGILLGDEMLLILEWWVKGSTDVNAKIKPMRIEIAICADNDAGVGSCSRLGFKSWDAETRASGVASGWERVWGERSEDLVPKKIRRKALVYELIIKGLDEHRTGVSWWEIRFVSFFVCIYNWTELVRTYQSTAVQHIDQLKDQRSRTCKTLG